jgi:hypothetical protein
MSRIGDAAAGLKVLLETIPWLYVYDSPPSAKAQRPSAEILPVTELDPVQPSVSDMQVVFPVRFEADAGRAADGWEYVHTFIDRTGTASFGEALATDKTLGGNACWARYEGLIEDPDRDRDNPSLFSAILLVRVSIG